MGWVVGHSYIVYGPLLNGATTIIFEGKPVGTPDAGAFWRVIAQHRVNALFTAPTAFRAIRRKIRRASASATTTSPLAHAVSRRRALPTPNAQVGRSETAGAGDRPLVADRDRLADLRNPVGLGLLPVKPGSPTVPCRATT